MEGVNSSQSQGESTQSILNYTLYTRAGNSKQIYDEIGMFSSNVFWLIDLHSVVFKLYW